VSLSFFHGETSTMLCIMPCQNYPIMLKLVATLSKRHHSCDTFTKTRNWKIVSTKKSKSHEHNGLVKCPPFFVRTKQITGAPRNLSSRKWPGARHDPMPGYSLLGPFVSWQGGWAGVFGAFFSASLSWAGLSLLHQNIQNYFHYFFLTFCDTL
jgi:hypothetical protein